MAIIQGIIIPKARKSAGNVTFRTIRGTTVMSEKATTQSGDPSAAQMRQRDKFGQVQKGIGGLVAAIAKATQRPDGLKSANNRLFKALYKAAAMQTAPDLIKWTNHSFFGDGGLYGEAAHNGTSLPRMVEGDVSDLMCSVSSFQQSGEQSAVVAVFDWVFNGIPEPWKGWANPENTIPASYSRIFFNSAGSLKFDSVAAYDVTFAENVTDFYSPGDAFPTDTVIIGADGNLFRVQWCVYVQEASAQPASVTSPLKYAEYRGLPLFYLNGVLLPIPWEV